MFTAIAVVDNGVVKAILWDNGCFDCEGKGYKCIGEDNASFCAVPEKNCSDDFNCEIQVSFHFVEFVCVCAIKKLI